MDCPLGVSMDDTNDRQAAFATGLTDHLRDLYSYFRRLGVDAATAEDLAQDTVLTAWQSLPALRDSRKLRSWLYGIGYRRYLQYRERAAARPTVELTDDLLASPLLDPAGDGRLLNEAIRSAVLSLPEEYLHPVVLLYWEGISYREAARILSLPMGTFAWRVHTAMKLLRHALAETCPAATARKGADNDPVPQESQTRTTDTLG
jgi:RNA polymerase sigma-70 factor, ECF subfamily